MCRLSSDGTSQCLDEVLRSGSMEKDYNQFLFVNSEPQTVAFAEIATNDWSPTWLIQAELDKWFRHARAAGMRWRYGIPQHVMDKWALLAMEEILDR